MTNKSILNILRGLPLNRLRLTVRVCQMEGEFSEITIERQFYRSLLQEITHHQWLKDYPDIDNIPK